MLNRFTAIGSSVTGAPGGAYPGEAIVWQSISSGGDPLPRRTFVVDVGQTKMMGARVSEYRPRIVVLTHDDSDHIGGFKFLDEAALGSLEELWVPFEWGALLFTLAQGMKNHPGDLASDESLNSVEAVIGRLRAAREQSDVRADVLASTNEILRDRIGLASDALKTLRSSDSQKELFRSLYVRMNRTSRGRPPRATRDAAERALERAEVLIQILGRASWSGALIRFFSVDVTEGERRWLWATAGYPGEITIMNAVEAGTPNRWVEDSLQFVAGLLTLTVQNRRALCTLLWSASGSHGRAAVWSDSAGDWLPTSFFWPLYDLELTTAPHHGSATDAHDRIWDSLAPFMHELLVVCAGGHVHQKGAHKSFLAVDSQARGCTRCRHGAVLPSRARDVVVTLGSAGFSHLQPSCTT